MTAALIAGAALTAAATVYGLAWALGAAAAAIERSRYDVEYPTSNVRVIGADHD